MKVKVRGREGNVRIERYRQAPLRHGVLVRCDDHDNQVRIQYSCKFICSEIDCSNQTSIRYNSPLNCLILIDISSYEDRIYKSISWQHRRVLFVRLL